MAVNGVAVLGARARRTRRRTPCACPGRALPAAGLNAIVLDVAPGGRALVDRIVFRPWRPRVNVEEYERMYEAEERQWWYAGMRAISAALLDKHMARAAAQAADPRRGLRHRQQPRALRAAAAPWASTSPRTRCASAARRGVNAARASVLALPFGAGASTS